jgi:hypothetical protein
MPLHPIVVHLPIALAVLMPVISAGILIAWARGALQRRTWVLAIALQALLVGSAIAALRSGEAEEDRVEATVPEAAIEAHEEAAEGFVIAAAVVLVLALGAGLIRRDSAARAVATLATVGTLGVLGLGYRTGKAGGELVYRHGAAAAYTSAPAPGASSSYEHEDDER